MSMCVSSVGGVQIVSSDLRRVRVEGYNQALDEREKKSSPPLSEGCTPKTHFQIDRYPKAYVVCMTSTGPLIYFLGPHRPEFHPPP